MKCEICKGETKIVTDQDYRYVESGLDHIYLQGVEVEICEQCDERSPFLPRILELHSVIGRMLALQPTTLHGKDVRFMRKRLGMRAREWAALMRVDVSTFSRWENDEQPLGSQSDTLLRLLYFCICEQREGESLPPRLAQQLATAYRYERDQVEIVIDVTTFRGEFRFKEAMPRITAETAVVIYGGGSQLGIASNQNTNELALAA